MHPVIGSIITSLDGTLHLVVAVETCVKDTVINNSGWCGVTANNVIMSSMSR